MAAIAVTVAALAGFGQFIARPLATDVLGFGRTITPLNNGNCQKVPELSGCEDLWIHHQTGLLYTVCSDGKQRHQWLPAVTALHEKERPKTDAVYLLDTKAQGPPVSRLTKLSLKGFDGVNGDGTINLHGIGVHVLPASGDEKPTLRVFLNNHRPSLDEQGELVDNSKTGANSTIEIFETTLGSDSLQHVRTVHDPLHIRTPNRVAPIGPDSFLVTNDHKYKVSPVPRDLIEAFGLSDVTYCDPSGCEQALGGLAFPNGILRIDGTNKYIIPSSGRGFQWLTEFNQTTKKLKILSKVPTGMPSDNDALGANGDVYAASFPQLHTAPPVLHEPNSPNLRSPSTIWRIPAADIAANGANGWHLEKVFEDEGYVGNMQTVANIHADKLYLSGVSTDALAICQL